MEKPKQSQLFLVIGAGTMGASIAQVLAASGFPVILSDINESCLEQAYAKVHAQTQELLNHNLADETYPALVDANLSYITSDQIPKIAEEIDIVIEAVFENAEVKTELFTMLNRCFRSDCIFISNTSGMDIFSLCRNIVMNPQRLIITHWFNPPHLMKLVEIVKGPETSDQTVLSVQEILKQAGKKTVLLNQYIPGFIVNRISTAINRELYHMIAQGWIRAEDAELALRYSHGLRFCFEGPIALWDYVGLKIPTAVARDILPTLCNDSLTIPLAERLLQEGKTGTAAGEGLLKWTDPAAYTQKRNQRIFQMTKIIEDFEKEDDSDIEI